MPAARLPAPLPPPMLKSFVLFCTVGVAATLTYFGALHLLQHLLGYDYRIAATGAYIASTGTHFLLNRNLTFADAAEGALSGELARYSALVGVNYLINITTVVVSVELLGLTSVQGALLAIPLTLTAGFTLARLWVFPSRSKETCP